MDDVYILTRRTKDGRERTDLAWFPTPQAREALVARSNKHGLEVKIENLCNN